MPGESRVWYYTCHTRFDRNFTVYNKWVVCIMLLVHILYPAGTYVARRHLFFILCRQILSGALSPPLRTAVLSSTSTQHTTMHTKSITSRKLRLRVVRLIKGLRPCFAARHLLARPAYISLLLMEPGRAVALLIQNNNRHTFPTS